IYLDLFLYPETKTRPSALMHVRGGKVVLQRADYGDRLLARIEKQYRRGPKALSSDELNARIIWAHKMLDRARAGDLEGNFRRVWLATALLEDYFVLRKRWYEGPKLSFRWLREHDPKTYSMFKSALNRDATITKLGRLVEAVTDI